MVTVDVWRARIGAHYMRTQVCTRRKQIIRSPNIEVVAFHFLIFLLLLVIGNVELNPGPAVTCSYCNAAFSSLGVHARHQKIHINDFNFLFECGACRQSFSNYASLSSHLSKYHGKERNTVEVEVQALSINCLHCAEEESNKYVSLADLCRHLLKDHLGNDVASITCPLSEECGREEPLASKNAFSGHLSKSHPGWRSNYSVPSAAVPVDACNLPATQSFEYVQDHVYFGDNLSPDSSAENDDEVFEALDFSVVDVMNFITSFYLMLEVECLLPVATIDKISRSLTFISESTQQLIRATAVKELESLEIPKESIRNVISKLPNSDPLYLSHHRHTAGPDLMTDHLRKKQFHENFPVVPVVYPNLTPKDSIDGDCYAYISPKQSFSLLLQDSSIKKEVEESFERNTCDPNLYHDYTSGAVFKSRNLPKKRIDLIFFQDGFSVTSMLTSVQDKFKTLGMYMTMGNLQPWQRTKLNAMQLVLLIFEKHVKKYRQKCFQKLVSELRTLEDEGIEFCGEMIPVYLQFITGDNLGSHFLGGFVEGFTATYFCRYCDVSKRKLELDPTAVNSPRTFHSYKRATLKVLSKKVKHYRGVKTDSVFNKLSKFKVTDPGLPPCLGHDLFHGVVDFDLSSILKSFIDRKWFSHELLNRRIAHFKYAAADLKNKPAPFKEGTRRGKKKLSGSAVQNWLLLRLLPFFVHDKINDFEDPHWKLYLKLKNICEIACAPEIAVDQLAELEILITSYLEERRILPAGKPKHHFLRHYPHLIHQLGPLIHLWAMRFEAKHQYFKKVAKACNNFVNLLKTLSSKCQLLFSYQSLGSRFKNVVSSHKPICFQQNNFKPDVTSAIRAFAFGSNLKTMTKVSVNGIKYRIENLIVLKKTPDGYQVGLIEAILLHDNKVYFVLRNKMATLNPNLGLYQINGQIGHLTMVPQTTLTNPCCQPLYSLGGVDSFSMKHVLPSI